VPSVNTEESSSVKIRRIIYCHRWHVHLIQKKPDLQAVIVNKNVPDWLIMYFFERLLYESLTFTNPKCPQIMKVDIRSLTALLSSSSCLLRIRMKRLHCCIHNKYFTTKIQFKTEKDPEAVSDLVWTVQQAMFRFVKYSGGGTSHELNDVVITYLLTYATCCYWWIMVLMDRRS